MLSTNLKIENLLSALQPQILKHWFEQVFLKVKLAKSSLSKQVYLLRQTEGFLMFSSVVC